MAAHDLVLVIGDPTSVFIQTPVRFWRERGVDARILAARWTGGPVVDGDLPVESAEALAPGWVQAFAHGLYPVLDAANRITFAHDPARVATALAAWAHTADPPSIVPPIYDALLLAAAADRLQPIGILGHEAFAYGLATSLSRAPRRTLLIWGADVLQFAPMSDVTMALVRQAVHGCNYLLVNSATMATALHERFGVPHARLAPFSFGIDRRLFRRAAPADARRIRERWGIPATARVVMNIRRFLPHWGSDVAWPGMAALAAARPDVHLVLLGGDATEAELDRAAAEARSHGLEHRVTFVRGQAPLTTVAELMSIADVGLSLVRTLEPVSWSVLQAAACGVALLVADQPSYALEADRGLVVHLTSALDPASLVARLTALLDDPAARSRMAAANDAYVTACQDRETELTRLLRIVVGAAAADRLLPVAATR